MFLACTRLGYDTINFLVGIVPPSLQKQDTCMQDCIPIEKRVVLSLARLGSKNNLMNCRKPFGLPNTITSIIVRQFCHVVKVHLMALMIPKLTSSRIAKIIVDF
jgi:hypothetical protein